MDSNGEVINITVPKPDAKPNKQRKINTLLLHQVKRLWEIEQRHVPKHRTGLGLQEHDLENLTEGQAAEFIRRMTRKLHELGAKPKRVSKAAKKYRAPEFEN